MKMHVKRILSCIGFAITLAGCDMVPTTDKVITQSAIPGVVAPVRGEKPVATVIDAEQFTGTVRWAPSGNTFAASTEYTATVVLKPKAGWTLTGVPTNFFTVAGAKAANDAGSGTVTAVFPETDAEPAPVDDTPLRAADYVNFEPGFGIRYHITDSYVPNPFNDYAWAISQTCVTNLPAELDFAVTLNRENGGNLDNSLGGMSAKTVDGKRYLMFYCGYPCGNQGNFFMNLMLPVEFGVGSTWKVNAVTYTIAPFETVTIGSETYKDCVRLDIVDTESNSYRAGSGYFLLAEGIGIVKIQFDRDDGSEVTFSFDKSARFVLRTLAGTVYGNDGTTPVEGKCVQISNANWGTRSVTGADGKFSLKACGPDIVLRVGDDSDGDGVFEFSATNPKDFWITGITGDQTDLKLTLSAP